MAFEKEIEEWFFNLYNQCYIKTFNVVEGKTERFYYNEQYIIKEKIYRINGVNPPKKNYKPRYLTFSNNLEKNILDKF